MADTPELPDVKDPFEKLVALTIAILAVVLSVVSNHGDNAATGSIIATNAVANQWACFQAKSIKQHVNDTGLRILGALPTAPAAAGVAQGLEKDSARYDAEKAEIKAAAEELDREAARQGAVNDRADMAGLVLQFALILASAAILSGLRSLWHGSVAVPWRPIRGIWKRTAPHSEKGFPDVQSSLERDIPGPGLRIPASTLRRFGMMLAPVHGLHWNAACLASRWVSRRTPSATTSTS
jgi:hypothetical protein